MHEGRRKQPVHSVDGVKLFWLGLSFLTPVFLQQDTLELVSESQDTSTCPPNAPSGPSH